MFIRTLVLLVVTCKLCSLKWFWIILCGLWMSKARSNYAIFPKCRQGWMSCGQTCSYCRCNDHLLTPKGPSMTTNCPSGSSLAIRQTLNWYCSNIQPLTWLMTHERSSALLLHTQKQAAGYETCWLISTVRNKAGWMEPWVFVEVCNDQITPNKDKPLSSHWAD